MSWADNLTRLSDKGNADLGEAAKAVKVEIFSGAILDTRVDTGRLRGNWQTQEGGPAVGELDRLDETGSIAIKEAESVSSEDGVTYFANNLPYAAKFERIDAMLARNIARVEQILAKAVK